MSLKSRLREQDRRDRSDFGTHKTGTSNPSRWTNDSFWKAVEAGRMDFHGENLSGLSFNRAILARVDFSGANLSGTNFIGANLSSANFSHADLHGTVFFKAHLHDADFTGARGVKNNRYLSTKQRNQAKS